MDKLTNDEFNLLRSNIPETDSLNRTTIPNSMHRISVIRDKSSEI